MYPLCKKKKKRPNTHTTAKQPTDSGHSSGAIKNSIAVPPYSPVRPVSLTRQAHSSSVPYFRGKDRRGALTHEEVVLSMGKDSTLNLLYYPRSKKKKAV